MHWRQGKGPASHQSLFPRPKITLQRTGAINPACRGAHSGYRPSFRNCCHTRLPWTLPSLLLCRAESNQEGSALQSGHVNKQRRQSFEAVVSEQLNALGMSHSIRNFQNAHVSGPVVDRRVYDQVAASRNRISKQLSAKNKYIRHLESSLEERSEAVEAAHQALLQVRRELETVQRLSELTSAACKFGLDKVDIANRSERVAKRAESLYQGLGTEVGTLDKLIFRKVPVAWYGLASDVRLVGDFDNWSEGFSLSPEEIRDQTFTKFTAEVPLRPGRYLVKFKVDSSQWRLASDWPTEEGTDGNTNNVLIVP